MALGRKVKVGKKLFKKFAVGKGKYRAVWAMPVTCQLPALITISEVDNG